MNEPRCDLPGLALVLFRFERVDEFDGGEEPDALAVMLNGLDANRCGQMRLARARSPYQDGVMRVLQELAAMKLAHQGLVDLAAGEVEAGEIAIVRKARALSWYAIDLTSRSAISAFKSCDKIGSAASKAGEPCSVSSLTACAMPCILRLRSMMTMAPAADYDAWRASRALRSAS